MKQILINSDRTLDLTQVRNILVGTDNLSETIQIQIDKFYEGEDLSLYDWYFVYKNANGQGEPILLETSVVDDKINMLWQPNSNFTAIPGRVEIQVFGLKTEGEEIKKWNSAPGMVYLKDGLKPDDFVPEMPVVLVEYLASFEKLEQQASEAANIASTKATEAEGSAETASIAATSAAESESQIRELLEGAESPVIAYAEAIAGNAQSIASNLSALNAHKNDTVNPHSVTKAQVGLGNVDNTADVDKPVSTAQQTALDLKIDNVEKGVANGVATLDSAGLVPSSQLPSYVDDTLEFSTFDDFPTTGETGKIYVDKNLNLTYRWSGTQYTEISKSLSTGETTGTAFDGARGKAVEEGLATHKNDIVNPHQVTAEQVGAYTKAETEDLIRTKVYGVKINHVTGEYTRLYDAVGKNFGTPNGYEPIPSDFDNIYPWNSIKHVKINKFGLMKRESDPDYNTFDGMLMNDWPVAYVSDYLNGDDRIMLFCEKQLHSNFHKIGGVYMSAVHAGEENGEVVVKVGAVPKINISHTQVHNTLEAFGDGKTFCLNEYGVYTKMAYSVIEMGSFNYKILGPGISSGMPYSSSDNYKLIADTVNGNTVTLEDLGQPFYVGMDVQIGTSYTNNSKAQNRKITNIEKESGNLILTLDGDSFTASIGDSCVTWAQSIPQEAIDAIGNGSGYYLRHGSSTRSPVCYRGDWTVFGNTWTHIAGFMRKDGKIYVCTDPTKMNVTDPDGADGWLYIGLEPIAPNGYQQKRQAVLVNDQYIDVPILWGNIASSSTFYAAYLYYFSEEYQGVRVLRLGGYWGIGASCSLFYSNGNNNPSNTSFNVGFCVIRYYSSQGS